MNIESISDADWRLLKFIADSRKSGKVPSCSRKLLDFWASFEEVGLVRISFPDFGATIFTIDVTTKCLNELDLRFGDGNA
jgi:hypothetical protein